LLEFRPFFLILFYKFGLFHCASIARFQEYLERFQRTGFQLIRQEAV
jgi:hypothetical protein